MIGKKQIVIDANNFVRGMSTTVDTLDGGFSPETTQINFIEEVGVVNARTDSIDGDGDNVLTGEIIASCPDSVVSLADARIMVTDDAKYVSYDGTKLETELDEDDTGSIVYADGFVDMIPFNGKIYTTNNNNITELTRPNTLDKTYMDFDNGAFPHPALVFENNAYYGDGENLLRQTPTVAPNKTTPILSLSTGHIITALGIDTGTGKMLIATTGTQNVSNTIPSVNKIMWYDGYSNKVIKSIIVEDIVTAFKTVAGVNYVAYGQNIGFLTGSGINFLRRLDNVTLLSTSLPYKQHLTNLGKTLCVVNGDTVVAFGEISPGRKVFHNLIDTGVALRAIFDVGSHKLGLSYATNTFHTLDTSDLSPSVSGGAVFYSLNYQFPRPVHIRSVKVFYKTAIAKATAAAIASIQLIDDTGTTTNIGTISKDPNNTQKTYTSASFSIKTSTAQLKYNIGAATRTDIHGVKRFIIYYDVAE